MIYNEYRNVLFLSYADMTKTNLAVLTTFANYVKCQIILNMHKQTIKAQATNEEDAKQQAEMPQEIRIRLSDASCESNRNDE